MVDTGNGHANTAGVVKESLIFSKDTLPTVGIDSLSSVTSYSKRSKLSRPLN